MAHGRLARQCGGAAHGARERALSTTREGLRDRLESWAEGELERDAIRDVETAQEQPLEDVTQALDGASKLNLTSLGDLAALPAIAKIPLIRDLLYPGAWLVVGRPKIGKSWLLLQMTLAVAEGGTFLGFNCASADALCIFGEDDNSRIQSRLAALGVANAPRNCHVINQQTLFALAKRFAAALTFPQFLEAWLDKHPSVRLIVIDTETTVRQVWASEYYAQDTSSRVTETDYRQTRTFDELALRRQLVILLVNHASKRKGEWIDIHELINRSNTALAGASGSITLADPPDADPFDPKQRTRVLGVRGRDLVEDVLLAVHQEKDLAHFLSDGPYAEVRQTEAEQDILRALEELMAGTEQEQYVTTEDLAAAAGKSRENVKRTITRMLSKGRTTWGKSRIVAKRGRHGGLRLDPLQP
jgi:hypothetical protein